MALLFVFYLVTAFVTLFFNTALVGAALERLRGGNPTLGTGFAVAMPHLPAIFVYALITGDRGSGAAEYRAAHGLHRRDRGEPVRRGLGGRDLPGGAGDGRSRGKGRSRRSSGALDC